MRDSHERNIEYARVSVTDRCNLRCLYCMPAEGVEKRRHEDILSYEDIVRVCRALSAAGVRTLRITGGEPLVRRGVAGLVRELKALPDIDSVTLMTNGVLLAAEAKTLRDAGLDGVNVSLDALDPGLYRDMTRGGDVLRALEGIDAALAHGFPAVKINCVPFAGKNDGELLRIAELARDRPLHVRFIEMMPLGPGASFRGVQPKSVHGLLEKAFGPPTPVPGPPGSGPARYFSLPGFLGTVGFIETRKHDICGRCNRLRLTSDGVLKACLHMDRGVSLKPALARDGDGDLARELGEAILRKPPHHEFAHSDADRAERRHMSQIGG
jgi:cyclic pyranopterin phosphate synthase